MIDIWASTYTPKVDEIVTIYGRSDIVEDIDVNVYDRDTGEKVAIYTIYIETLGTNYIRIKPGLLGYHLRFVGVGRKSGDTDSFNMDVQVTKPPSWLSLSASNTKPKPGEIVTFTITTDPGVNWTAQLYAYVEGAKAGVWDVPIANGVGSIRLVPSVIGDVTDWQAEANGVKSNIVRVEVQIAQPSAIYLSASKTSGIEPGEIVTFTVSSPEPVDFTADLFAYVGGVKVGQWKVSVLGGVGSIKLVPSEIGGVVDWQAEAFGLKSNIVTTSLVAYNTRISISAPDTVTVNQVFAITGKLEYESSPGVWKPLTGRTVSLYYNGIKIGDVATGSDGSYSKSTSIPTPGTYTLKAVYAGEGALATAMTILGVSVPAEAARPLIALAPMATGSIIAFLGCM